MDIKKKIKSFPNSPGVYLMEDKKGAVLYVGKASSLRKRVSSYYQKPPTDKTQALLSRTVDIDYIQTTSSAQALLLENSLIKRYRPYYNAALKDDKSYPFVKIAAGEDYPYLLITRAKLEKGAQYFGPYTNVRLLKAAIKAIRSIFPFRSCLRLPKKPCLYFQLKLCPGMCAKKVDKYGYRENLRQLGLFLEGRYKQLLKELEEKMRQVAKNQCYEEAAILRDKISSLAEIIAQTKETRHQNLILDLSFKTPPLDPSLKRNRKVYPLGLDLERVLKLPKLPYRIEAFDISQTCGKEKTGSMVSFLGGLPDKKNYRKFRIKTVQGIDDYAMICEVLRRRYGKKKDKQTLPFPDLVMIDGGKGHLSCAQKELKSLGLAKLPVIALAKRLETIYTSSGTALTLPGDSKLLHLLQRIRDEAHRFAFFYHRKLRQRDMRMSLLDEIPGVGLKRKQDLLRHFKSVQAIKEASVADLLRVKVINREIAENIFRYVRKIRNPKQYQMTKIRYSGLSCQKDIHRSNEKYLK